MTLHRTVLKYNDILSELYACIQHFNYQLTHTVLKNLRVIKTF